MWEHFGKDNFTRIIGQEIGRKSEYWGELSTRDSLRLEDRPWWVSCPAFRQMRGVEALSYCDGSCKLRAAPPPLVGDAQPSLLPTSVADTYNVCSYSIAKITIVESGRPSIVIPCCLSAPCYQTTREVYKTSTVARWPNFRPHSKKTSIYKCKCSKSSS